MNAKKQLFFVVEFQLVNVEEIKEIENHHFVSTIVMRNHQVNAN